MKSSEYPNTNNEEFYSGEMNIPIKDLKLEEVGRMLEGYLTE